MNIHILEMPLDFGASRHGSDMGPSAMRLAGLKERLVQLNHTVQRHFSPVDLEPQEYENPGDPALKYLKPIAKACSQLACEVEAAVDAGAFPLVLGGDHSIVLGSLAGLAASHRNRGGKIGVLNVDAHGDFNTDKTSLSGNIHGMCMAASCGYGVPELTGLHFEGRKIDPANVCYVGLRDIDPEEKKLMKTAGVMAFTMSDIDRAGFSNVLRDVTRFFRDRVDAVHVSFDMDVIDPMFAPGVGIPLPGGLNSREALLLMEEMCTTGQVRSADFVEVNPILDVRNQTARMAVELIARLLGDSIY